MLRLIEAKDIGADRPLTRARLAEITLKRLWNRNRLEEQFLAELSEWLLTAGWALLFAGSTYGAVRTSVVENWSPISSKRIQPELDAVAAGQFDFTKLEDCSTAPARTIELMRTLNDRANSGQKTGDNRRRWRFSSDAVHAALRRGA